MSSKKYCSAVSDGRKTYSVLKMSNSINLWTRIKSGGELPDHFPCQFWGRKEDNDIYKNKGIFTSNKYVILVSSFCDWVNSKSAITLDEMKYGLHPSSRTNVIFWHLCFAILWVQGGIKQSCQQSNNKTKNKTKKPKPHPKTVFQHSVYISLPGRTLCLEKNLNIII